MFLRHLLCVKQRISFVSFNPHETEETEDEKLRKKFKSLA